MIKIYIDPLNSLEPSNLETAYVMLKEQPIEESKGNELLNYILCDMRFNHLSQEQEVILDRIVRILDIEGLY